MTKPELIENKPKSKGIDQKSFEAYREACLENASNFLLSVRRLNDPTLKHIAYHLAVSGLEELGKLEMVKMLRMATMNRHEPGELRLDLEDHEAKLFFAFFGVSFGRELITKESMLSHKNLARNIHRKRLSSLYVNSDSARRTSALISNDELDNAIKMLENRLKFEELSNIDPDKKLGEKEQKELEWFLMAPNDPETRTFIFSGESNKKLVELGDAQRWVEWMYTEWHQRQKEAQKIVEAELARERPTAREAGKPKWSLRIRVGIPSHSVKPSALTKFNIGVHGIQLYPTKDKNELVIEFILPRSIPLVGLWQFGLAQATLFLAAFNIGSLGFVWWHVQRDTATYYEDLKDLDNNSYVPRVEMNPKLEVDWRAHKLTLEDRELGNIAAVYGYLASHKEELEPAISRYVMGLTLLSKNDMHLRVELNAFMEFITALELAIRSLEKLGPDANVLEALRQLVSADFYKNAEEMFEIYHGVKQDPEKSPQKPITLSEAFVAKLQFDQYIHIKTREWVKKQRPLKS